MMSRAICYYAKKRSLDPVMVLSIAKHESSFSRYLISHTSDYGLMQINSKSRIGTTEYYGPRKCDLLKTWCNVKWGTYIMAMWKRVCSSHKHRRPKHFHWIKHYNWYGDKGTYYLKILWLTKAYKKAWSGRIEAYSMIRARTYPRRLKRCLERKDLCIVD